MTSVYYIKSLEDIYLYKNGRVAKTSDIETKKAIYTSSIYYSDVTVITFKLKDVIEEMIESEVYKYLFNEGGLTLGKEYVIKYIYKKINNEYLIDAFVIEIEKLNAKFKEIIKKVRYLDFISLRFMAFSEYYELANVEKNGTDVFIYFDENESYAAFFENGEFCCVKSLTKLSSVFKGESLKKVIKNLKEKGFDSFLYEDIGEFEELEKFFNQFFGRLSSVITYAISSYSISSVKNIYFYTPFEIKNFFEHFEKFFEISGYNFKKLQLDTSYDYLDYLTTYFNVKHYTEENINFSIFKRPPPIYKTESGKFIIFAFVLFLFLIGDIGYRFMKINSLKVSAEEYQLKVQKQKSKIDLMKEIIKKYEQKIDNLQKEVLEIQNQILDMKTKVEFLYKIFKEEKFSNVFADIVNLAAKNNLLIKDLSQQNSHIILTVQTSKKYVRYIPDFMKELIKLNYKNVTSKEIKNTQNEYIALVEFDYD
jgi:Mg2+ and Co2+ transporter CorA